MNVHASDNRHVQHAWMNAKSKHDEARTAAQEGASQARRNEISAPPEATGAEGSKGVIRLLQEGHFSGVADVRLRINFHDELQQAAAQNAATAFESAFPGLLDDLAAKAGALGEEYDLSAQDKELAESFADEIQLLLEEDKAAQTPLSTTLESINTTFSSFLEKLEGAFAGVPAVEEPAPEEQELGELQEDGDAPSPDEQTPEQLAATPTEEGADALEEGLMPEEDTTLKTALQDLSDWFSASLGTLQSDATAAQQLPPLSEPRGNGAAYSKFLEIYKNLSSGAGTGATPADDASAQLNAEV